MSNEQAFTQVENAINHLRIEGDRLQWSTEAVQSAISTLFEAHKAIGPLGQIPSWERQ